MRRIDPSAGLIAGVVVFEICFLLWPTETKDLLSRGFSLIQRGRVALVRRQDVESVSKHMHSELFHIVQVIEEGTDVARRLA